MAGKSTSSLSIVVPIGILFSIMVLYLIANRYGLGYTYDSHLYVDIAEEISSLGIWLSEGLKIKPPLYPLLIVLVGEANLVYTNLILLLISALVLFLLGEKLHNPELKIAYWLSLVMSTPMILVHSFFWTEPLFITVLLIMFYLLMQYESDRNWKFLTLALLLLFTLPFIRFAGIFILIPTLIYLIISVNANQRIWIMTSLGLGVLLFIFWVSHFEEGFLNRWNVLVSPFLRLDFTRYIDNTDSYLEALSMWIMPLSIFKFLRVVATGLALLGLVYLSIQSVRKKSGILHSGVFFIFIIYYFSLQTVFHVEYYSAERYLTPLYHLLVLALLLFVEEKLKSMNGHIKKLVYGALILWTLYGVARTTKNVYYWNQVRSEKII